MGTFAVMNRSKRANRSREDRPSRQGRSLDDLPDRLYTIREAAEIFGLEEHVLRYWEKVTPLAPRRMPGGSRRYSTDDLRLIERICYLVEGKGMTVQAAAAHLEHPDVDLDMELKGRLLTVRQHLLALRDRLGETIGITEDE